MMRSPGIKTRKYLREKYESASAQVVQSTPLLEEQPRCVRSNITIIKKSVPSVKSSASSVAKKKQLELEAAEARAKIALELIDKKLEADLAAVDMEEAQERQDGSQSSRGVRKVEEWLEKTHTEGDNASIAHQGQGRQTAPAENPVINELAHTLQGLMRQTASHHEERLLTRLATPRELPVFDGDCFEWLHFKSAYDESTRVCNFSDTENLWRLRKALRGQAKEAVTDLLIGHSPPSTVMETLHLLFGRPDIIIQNLMKQLRKLPNLPPFYQTDLIKFSVKVNNCVATVQALKQKDILWSTEITSVIISKFPSTLLSKWTEYAYTKLQGQHNSKLELLAAFLKLETEMLCTVGVPQLPERNRIDEMPKLRNNRPNIFATTSTNEQQKCKFCKKSVHMLADCRLFRRALRKDRWRFIKTNRLCFSCLSVRHEKDACTAPVCDVEGCGLQHHRLLHWSRGSSPPRRAEIPVLSEESTASTVAHVTASDNGTALLKIVKVKLCGPKGHVITHALLDDAASVSLISTDLVQTLGLKCEQSSPTKFIDAFGLEVYHADAPIVRARISSVLEDCTSDIKFRKCNLNLPAQDLSIIKHLKCKHLLHIKHKVCDSRIVPQLLIGEDNYHLIAPLEILHGGKNDPYATRCCLGWCIHGYCARAHTHVSNSSIFYLSQTPDLFHGVENVENDKLSELNKIIKDSFQFDAIGISTVYRENKAHTRAIKILDETCRLVDKQWEVGLPFKNDSFVLPDSYPTALSRLQVLLKKFERDSDYKIKYSQEIQKLLDEGYARTVEEHEMVCKHKQAWYLPHFGVLNPNKPGKLRLVYDAAARVSDVSLNDLLLTGPDLYNSLFGIMLQFREGKIAFTGDIKDMFLRIKIRREDHNYMRFLWHDGKAINTYCMQNLIFGATCSPFVAQYVKNKNALRFEDVHPEAVNVIINSHYMDDCLYTTDNENKAIELINQITNIHKNGGFEIRNWASNSKAVVGSLPSSALAPSALLLKHGATNISERTLGLMWYPADDMFGFQINLTRIPPEILNGNEAPTKAKMLSIIMSVYDIHGFLSPFLIKSKIILQNVHRSGVDWRCRIHDADHIDWVSWLDELKQLISLRIPRHYVSATTWTPCYDVSPSENKNIVRSEMHVFCDASIKAYAAVIYFRFIDSFGNVSVCFVTSKCRVTPLRPVSVPRLELQAAMIAARLARTVNSEHKRIKINKRYFWTDSHTVLHWIRSDPRTFKPYVAHRLGEIDELSSVNEWRYVPSSLNAADVATKSKSPPLKYDQMWFQGPDFLRQNESQWPKDMRKLKTPEEAICEQRAVLVLSVSVADWGLPEENRFSSWLKLVRTTARILFFIKKCQRQHVEMNVDLIEKAQQLLIKRCQADTFQTEINYLRQGQPLPSDSRLRSLTPYVDDSGVLRVGGRIDKVVGVSATTTRPIILDGKHQLSRLLVEYYHRQALHGSNELVVNELRQKFWIIKLRPTVRGIAARCLFCKYRRAKPQPQRMADLPDARLQHSRRPFTYTGLDYFGPMEVTVGRRREKRYGVLFTCLTIRAIHIEIAESLTTDSAIMALQRMIARRGAPSVIFSDNGTNLRGTDVELKNSIKELNAERMKDDGLSRGIDWRFIPPGAPEMGGSWERMIRTVKSALRTVLKERAPHQETLYTLMSEVEALVNSRPITHVSDDPFYPEALTPNHFLIGTSSIGPAVGTYSDADLCLRRRWRVAQRLTDLFWNRWLKEYLPTLLPRQKWHTEVRSLKVGDYVVICEQNVERGSWRHGVVSATHAGSDGRVRVVDVRTRTGVLRRPVTRVALLSPVDSSAD